MACRPEATSPAEPVELRSSWTELPASEIALSDGTRVVTGWRWRSIGARLVLAFDYRKVGDPAESGASFAASLEVKGAEVQGGPTRWSLGADGPDLVELELLPAPGRVEVIYRQRAESPGQRPIESKTRLCFVAGEVSTRLAREGECGR